MKDFVKVKCGAITKIVPKGSLKWYLAARYRIVEDEVKNETKTNTTKTTTK